MSMSDFDLKYINCYTKFLNEMAISDYDIDENVNMLSDVSSFKDNLKNLKKYVNDLRNVITNSDSIKLSKLEYDNNLIYFYIDYKSKANTLVGVLGSFLDDDIPEIIRNKYVEIIYPDERFMEFRPNIEIETNNFNRIHIPDGLPFILKNIGLGKQIYRKIIKKLNYISTQRTDQTLDAIFVWDSLRKDKDIYSFIREKQMICFNPDFSFENIEKILKDFFEFEIDNEKNGNRLDNYILDTDFRERYKREILKSELKYLLKMYKD